jgi:hypothetical protein
MKICKICNLDETKITFEKVRKICTKCRSKQLFISKQKWKQINKEKVINTSKLYYINNKERLDRRNTDYYFNNKDKVKIARNKYRSKNREKFKLIKKNRLINDINYKLSLNLRSRVNSAIKRTNSRKISNTTKLIGCSIDKLKLHLQSKFLPTMSWDNYGKYWHIDHIIPCSNYDLTKGEEQKKCFNYTNLQPLFAITQIINEITYIGNLNKNDKIL